MSASALVAELDRMMNELGTARFEMIQARQKVIDTRNAIQRMQSRSPESVNTYFLLDNVEKALGENVQALLTGHEYLTDWRMRVS